MLSAAHDHAYVTDDIDKQMYFYDEYLFLNWFQLPKR